jgi:hypothetical protein
MMGAMSTVRHQDTAIPPFNPKVLRLLDIGRVLYLILMFFYLEA